MSDRYVRGFVPKGHVPKGCPNLVQTNVLLEKRSWEEVRKLAQSRGMTVAAFIRELIEIGLMELEEEGEICR